jgi:pimeloyl-ACP methyl ester carboxylesterase
VVGLNGTANMLEYAGFADAIAEAYGGSKADKPEVYRQRSAELALEKLAMPVALTTGGKDTLVPPDSVLRLAEALKRLKRPVLLIHRPEGGHSTDAADTKAAFQFVFDQLDNQERR